MIKYNYMEKIPSIQTSDQINDLTKALLKFDLLVGKIKKDKENPFFKSSYAPLETILEAIQQPLQESGLVVKQYPLGENWLQTTVFHAETGQFISSCYYMKPVKDDPQAFGSVITYQRRYALGAVLGLNIDDDDDGNKVSKTNQSKDERPWLSDSQFNGALKRINEGEKELYTKLDKEFRIRKSYRETLKKAAS